MRLLRRKPTPALVIAMLALFVSLGGTSFAAATLINGRQIKPHTIAKNRLTNKAVKQLKGNIGPAGPAGPAGTALAYAHINGDGTLDTTHSKNVSASNLVVAGSGIYCATVSVPVSNVTVTVDSGNNGGYFGYASAVLAGQDPTNFLGTFCPAGSSVLIAAVDSTGTPEDFPTWVVFN